MGMTLAERAEATQAVIERFRDKPFDWRTSGTCIHLFRAQAVAMGHTLPPIRRFRSALSAKRALDGLGHDSVGALIEALLPGARIAPAEMIVGDVGVLPGEQGLDAVVICAGAKVLGWHGADPSRLLPIDVCRSEFLAAWRLGA